MEQVVHLASVGHLIRQWWRGILAWVVAGIVVASAVTWLMMTPKYASTVQILVNQRTENANIQYTNQQGNVQMITTYKQLLTNPVILKPAQRQLKATGVVRSLTALKREMRVSSVENSQVLSLTVTDHNSRNSQLIANQVAQSFKQRIRKIIRINNVTIVSPAQRSTVPVSPQPWANLGIGALLGFLIGLTYAAIRDRFDRRVQVVNNVIAGLNLPVIGVIQHQPTITESRLAKH